MELSLPAKHACSVFYCLIGFYSFLSALSNVWASHALNSNLPTKTASLLTCQEHQVVKNQNLSLSAFDSKKKREAEQSQLERELVYYWDTARWGYQKSIKLYSNKSSLVEEVTFDDSTFTLKDFLPSLLQLIRSYPDPQLSQINSVRKGPLEITQASAPAQGMSNYNRLLGALSSQVFEHLQERFQIYLDTCSSVWSPWW